MRFFRLRPENSVLTECRLSNLEHRMHRMALDITKLEASEQALLTAVDALLSLQVVTADKVAQLASQLAAAGTNEAALQTVQDRLNQLAQSLTEETAKVAAVVNPQPTPTGPAPTA